MQNKFNKQTEELKKSLDIIDRYVIRSSTDTKGNIIDVSEAFCKISGYTKEELMGKPHSIVRHPDMESSAFRKMWETISSGKTWTGKIKNRTKNGEFYWVEAFIEPQFDDEGLIKSYTAVRTDITDKVLLKEQTEKNEAIIKFAKSGIGTMDLEGNFLSVNKVYSEIFLYSQEEIIGKNCLDMTTEEFYEEAQQTLKLANEMGAISHFEKECYDKNGNVVRVDFSLNKLPDNQSFVVVINSLEDKRRLEQVNAELSLKVLEEVEKNTKQLELIQEEQLKSVKLSSIGALAAGITHEINTPLTYIKGNLELMGYDIEDLPEGSIKERIEDTSYKIIDGVNRVANIVDAMREVSQISNETKAVENIYNTLLTALTVSHNASVTRSKIYLNGELFNLGMEKDKLSFLSYIQKQRVEQVWIVIINNALDELIKIDDYEQRVLEIKIDETKDMVRVLFKDNAGGIKENMLEKIFDPFVSTKESGGIGVGLNIAKKIIDEQAGKIMAYNEDDGAVFEVLLPKVDGN